MRPRYMVDVYFGSYSPFNINSQTAFTVNHTPFPSLQRGKGEKKVFKNKANYLSILPVGP